MEGFDVEKAQILDIIVKHYRANVDIPEDVEIDPAKSMLDQGAGSLDVVEITTAAMRELGVRVPRTELSKLTNIDELVDVFYGTVNAGA